MDAAFVYAKPQFKSTGLANNTRQCSAVLEEAGWTAVSLALDDVVGDYQSAEAWGEWLATARPRLVVLSAFCVPTVQFEQLAIEWPDVLWVQRCHSNLPWLFQAATDCDKWLEVLGLCARYRNVRYAVVSPYDAARLRAAGLPDVLSMPNVQCGEVAERPRAAVHDEQWLHLSAIFAIRNLKHPAGHVVAAKLVSEQVRPAKLHMQGERADSPRYVENMLKLANALRLRLVREPYRQHSQFCDWIAEEVDVGLQLSMTESFNYVALEHMSAGKPMVTSPAIPWCPWRTTRYENVEEVPAIVARILSDYRGASEQALAAARAIQAENEAMFLETCRTLLGDG